MDDRRDRRTEVDSILIGMGERYDAVITLADGVFPLIAQAEGKRDRGFALVRTGDGSMPAVDVSVSELDSDRVGTADGSVSLFWPRGDG
ncbi:MAG: hypothetical protein BGO95_11065 [Micrococcales bacterium 73-13]|nr:MAG: hypothetical protein BGO95_11065 [Micrococcales bacterium 73-13]